MTAVCDRLHEFADGRLAVAEADAFRDHLAECARCQEELHDVMQLSAIGTMLARPTAVRAPAAADRERPAARRGARRRPWPIFAAGALAAAAAVAAVMLSSRGPRHEAPSFSRLRAERGIEARLGHGPADRHRPYSVARGSAPGAPEEIPFDELAALEARGDLEGVAAALLLRRDLAGAEAYLDRAGDTPAARVTRAAIALDKNDPERALELVDGVPADAPARAQALWNRALALRALGLELAAAEAFAAVAVLGETGWADEATRRAEDARRAADERRRGWERTRQAGAALITDGTPMPPELVRAHPGLARLTFHDALRAAPSKERVLALAELAGELDRIYGGDALAAQVRRAAGNDFARRAPLTAIYAELAAGKRTLDAAARDEYLARLDQAGETDLLMGAIVLTGQAGARLDRYAPLAAASGDPWFELLAATEEAKRTAARGDLLAAERRFAVALARCDRERLDYRCTTLELNLGYLYQRLHRPDDARRIALAGLRRATAGGEWAKEALFAQVLADAARFRREFAVMRAYYQEALLRQPDNCRLSRDAHEAMSLALVFAVRPAEARRELTSAPRCDLPVTLVRATAVAELARRDGTPEEAAALRADLAALRASGSLDPGNLAHSLAIEGRLVIARDRDDGARVLREAIKVAGPAPRSVDADKGRLYAYRSLMVDAAQRGDHAGALALFAEEAGIPPPARCAVAAMVDDDRALVIAKGAGGAVQASFDEQLAARPSDVKVPPALVQSLSGCPRVDVLALPPLQGRNALLPPDIAWSYRSSGAPRNLGGARRRLVVSGVQDYPELGLPALEPWPGEGAADPARVDVTGLAATPARVAAEMLDATEIEIHTHGVVDQGLSDASVVVLSPDAAGKFTLTAREVAGLKLRGAPLVILAACRAASTAPYLHLAWSLPAAFVQAGARAVFAPATPVPDAEAGRFFDAVRRRIREGADPAAALRDERVSWLKTDPASWTRDVLLFE